MKTYPASDETDFKLIFFLYDQPTGLGISVDAAAFHMPKRTSVYQEGRKLLQTFRSVVLTVMCASDAGLQWDATGVIAIPKLKATLEVRISLFDQSGRYLRFVWPRVAT